MFSDDEIRDLMTPLRGFRHVGLAVSGGGDSMALMLLAQAWAAGAQDAPNLTILTVDHGLRPESRRDAEWVVARAADIGLTGHILTWPDAPARASQEEARAARYDLLSGFARDHGIEAVVTAHTRDDMAETFLMRLARGSGIDGLAAIEPETTWRGKRVLRPLLDVSRAQLRAELEARGADWLEDPSNADVRFERVRVRAALPALADLGITPARIAESAGRLRRACRAIEEAATAFLAEHVAAEACGYLRVNSPRLASVPDEVAIRVLQRMLCAVGGRSRPPRLRKLEMLIGHLNHVSRVAMTLGGCVLTRADREDALIICREPGRLRAGPTLLRPHQSVMWDGRFRVRAGELRSGAVIVDAFGEANLAALPEALRRGHPRPALAAMPALYADGEFLGVPLSGYASGDEHPDVAACHAEFLWPASAY